MPRTLSLLALCAALTGVGLIGGWFAARQAASPASGAGDHAEAGDAAPAAPSAFDQRTLDNIGVKVVPARKRTFVAFRPVQAVVVDRPQNVQPVVAPFGGIITAVHTRAGGTVIGDGAIVTIAREPIARPKPELTADLVTPISEDVHEAASNLRTALGTLAIVDRNLARVREAASGNGDEGLPVFRRSLLEYENERARTLVEVEGARRELERHGLGADEIQTVADGGDVPSSPKLWEHALRQNGLWSEVADAVRAAVPAADRNLPWCVAAIGELSAAGLATKELAAALVEDDALSTRFAEVAGLLLQGTPLDTVRLLGEQGALEPVFDLNAPDWLTDWDVLDVSARVGLRVEAGASIARLHDAREMWLRLEPVGEEIGYVVRALSEGEAVEAVPQVAGSGPTLGDLRLSRVDTIGSPNERGGGAFVHVTNERVCPTGAIDDSACSWSLRAGLRYFVRIPVDRWENRFVLPATAIARRGAERVVFLRDGEMFRPQVVRVEYEDDQIVVLADDGSIFDDEPVVTEGAFALGLALLGSDAPVDPHAGHNH